MTAKIPDPDKNTSDSDIRYVNLYESENKIYTRKIKGFYQSIRRYTGIPLLLGFLLMPWLVIDGRPAVFFDLSTRQFNILWITFGPRDGILLAGLLIISAFALFTVTAFLGRVWCGFTCPQTVWTLMFIWAEHVCEGDRNKRIKLDQSDWNIEKVLRKSGKYSLWLIISFITGATFIGYFLPIRELLSGFIPSFNDNGLLVFDGSLTAMFWTVFFASVTFLNAGFMREQVCKYMCPYARFQSAMYDSDTLAVHYDKVRGEARGPRKTNEDYKAAGKGDCIDCSWCVQVCPVDIDIREGLQYECINCGLCVDACNSVMDKMNYPRGLIRFTSDDELQTGKTHYFRLRVLGYIVALFVMIILFASTVANRQPVTLDISRDRGAHLFRVRSGQVQNVYRVKIHNMDRQSHEYRIKLSSDLPFEIVKHRPILLDEGEIFSIPVRVSIPKDKLNLVKSNITFTVTATDDETMSAQESATFIGPSE
ncbi:cytochrome c oxidase accessory protein CcoG [Candidatus Endobugula sertula]|uniref:Cytochrome c oxidase accessory protein CcoG n=1 Tax=Candidatus Endobugula sertula TaxID=62101 RepID=A0A1D2QRQ9_9GAMM|nr:cytochrome c oxidase accessory protein CcoG [Candidatus Endobugula sertula]